MVESEKTKIMRRRLRHLGEKAKRAVEEGGTSYGDIDALIQELKVCRLAKQVLFTSEGQC